jgi:hypothetical protein
MADERRPDGVGEELVIVDDQDAADANPLPSAAGNLRTPRRRNATLDRLTGTLPAMPRDG